MLLVLFINIHAIDILLGDLDQSFLRPRHEPVDGSVVDQRREVSCVVSELLSYGRHADRQVHVVLHSAVEPFVHYIWLFNEGLACSLAELLVWNLHFVTDATQLFGRVDVWHHTGIEHVLNVFEERLVHDIVVGEDEHSL